MTDERIECDYCGLLLATDVSANMVEDINGKYWCWCCPDPDYALVDEDAPGNLGIVRDPGNLNDLTRETTLRLYRKKDYWEGDDGEEE